MPWGSKLLCLWPGLARLWLRGDGYSLALAISYSVLFNLALISSLIWPDYLGRRFPLVAWPLLSTVWVISFCVSWRSLPQLLAVGTKAAAMPDTRLDTLFINAQQEYLRGNWLDARNLLEQRLRLRPRDVESRLLLVGVLRHLKSYPAVLEELQLLEGMDEARPWSFEVNRERGLVSKLMNKPIESMGDSAQELHPESSADLTNNFADAAVQTVDPIGQPNQRAA